MILAGFAIRAAYDRATTSELRKPDSDLALCRLRRIRAVHEIERDLGAELAADRPRIGLDRIGRADHLASRLDGVRPVKNHRDELAARDEFDELAEERLVL